MNFNDNQAIYLQIADWISDKIMKGEWEAENRIPSVRELGALLEVNPNTVMRAYEKLQVQDVIYNRRGIGYFVSPNADKNIRCEQRNAFFCEELPHIFQRMELLSVDISEINKHYETFKAEKR